MEPPASKKAKQDDSYIPTQPVENGNGTSNVSLIFSLTEEKGKLIKSLRPFEVSPPPLVSVGSVTFALSLRRVASSVTDTPLSHLLSCTSYLYPPLTPHTFPPLTLTPSSPLTPPLILPGAGYQHDSPGVPPLQEQSRKGV